LSMALVIQKFGGTSLKTPHHIHLAAEKALLAQQQGHQVIVVTSAMANTTNQLLDLAHPITLESTAETDVLLASGEQVSAALMALCLQKKGIKSRSYLTWQLPLITNETPGGALIYDINTQPLKAFMDQGGIPVIPGFQGLSRLKRLTTLGRGGSDITALALAAFFKQQFGLASSELACTIYTDVKGVFSADPRYVPEAQQLSSISFYWMRRMAEKGAKVLHPHALRYAHQHSIPFDVRSSFESTKGTLVTAKADLKKTPFLLSFLKDWHPLPKTPQHAAMTKLIERVQHKNPHHVFHHKETGTWLIHKDAYCATFTHNAYQPSTFYTALFIQGPGLSPIIYKQVLRDLACPHTLPMWHKDSPDPLFILFCPEENFSKTLNHVYTILHTLEKKHCQHG